MTGMRWNLKFLILILICMTVFMFIGHFIIPLLKVNYSLDHLSIVFFIVLNSICILDINFLSDV